AKILEDDRHPIIVKATEFAFLANDESVLPPLTKHIESRNGKLALAALRALRKIARQDPKITRAENGVGRVSGVTLASFALENRAHQNELLETLQRVLADSYIDRHVRDGALSVLELFSPEETSGTLLALLNRTDLETSTNLHRIEQLIRERGIQIR
ncbi:MAG: hypothetical protein AAF967_14815, partial [Pseudomonadota bacterium]